MKKLFILGALAIATLSFANDKKETKETKNVPAANQTSKSDFKIPIKKAAAAVSDVYSTSFKNKCGQETTVIFSTQHEHLSPGFIDDLANAVNWAYEICD